MKFRSQTMRFGLLCVLVMFLADTIAVTALPAVNKIEAGAKVKLHPIIVIPGLAGSQGFGNKDRKDDAKRIWVQAKNLLFPGKLISKFELKYNKSTKKTSDRKYGVVFPGQGESWSVRYLGSTASISIAYMRDFFEFFENSNKFYKSNSNLMAMPYDFRKGPNENRYFIPQLKQLVERMHRYDGKVVLVGHSMGGLMMIHFLNSMTDEWKRKYIKVAVPVAAPFGGSVKMLEALISGTDFDIVVVRGKLFRALLTSFPSTYMLLPKVEAFGDDELIEFPAGSITAENLPKLFEVLDGEIPALLYENSKNVFNLSAPTDVNVECLYSTGIDTVQRLVLTKLPVINKKSYDQDTGKVFPEKPKAIIDKLGDGTVGLKSLDLCRNWGRRTRVGHYNNVDHLQLITHKPLLQFIKLLAQSTTS